MTDVLLQKDYCSPFRSLNGVLVEETNVENIAEKVFISPVPSLNGLKKQNLENVAEKVFVFSFPSLNGLEKQNVEIIPENHSGKSFLFKLACRRHTNL